jgi:hypothetical protein
MASIEVIVRDDAGNILRQRLAANIELGDRNLQGVESAVEAWRKTALPEISAGLLEIAQQDFSAAQTVNRKCGATADES